MKDIYFIPDVSRMVLSALDWDEFRSVPEQTVSDWIASMYGWEATFTREEAQGIVDLARNNGYNFY